MQFNEAYADTCSSVGLAARTGDKRSLSHLLVNGRPANRHDNRGWKPLHEAAANGHLECAKLLLKYEDVDPDWRTFEGETALYLTCQRSNSTPMVKLLLKKRASVNLSTNEAFMPIHAAVTADCVETVKLLVQKGALINSQDYTGQTALHAAAAQNNLEIISFLLEHGANPHLMDDCWQTPFFTCARFGHVEAMRLLQQHGVTEMNVRSEDGATPLMIAAQFGHLSCVKFLLENGADPDCHTDDSVMAVHLAVQKGHESVLESLIEVTNPATIEDMCLGPLLNTSHWQALRQPLKPKNPRSISPFQLAIDWDQTSCLKVLLGSSLRPDTFLQPIDGAILPDLQDADFSTFPYKYETPLSYILSYQPTQERLTTVRMLLAAGSSVTPVKEDIIPPLLAVLLHQKQTYRDGSILWQCVKLVVEQGATLKCRRKACDLLSDAAIVAILSGIGAFTLLLKLGISPAVFCCLTFFRYLSKVVESAPASQQKWLTVYYAMVVHVLTRFTGYELQKTMGEQLKGLLSGGAQLPIWDKILEMTASPRCLQQLSRVKIREQVCLNRSPKQVKDLIQQLQLPVELQRYLMFDDVDIGEMEDMFWKCLADMADV